MRGEALRLAVEWHKRWYGPNENYPASKVVDTANVFLVFLEGAGSPAQERKNPAATKGQPR